MKTRTKKDAEGTHDLRESLQAGVKKLKKHGKRVIAVLTTKKRASKK